LVLPLLLAAASGFANDKQSALASAEQSAAVLRYGTFSLSANPTVEEFFHARVFEEPLVPIGPAPTPEENAALAAALVGYAQRSGPDDFSGLTRFLDEHPRSSWNAALLICLGLEYYNTAHYWLALDAWSRGWSLAKDASDPKGKLLADRAAGELAYMYARLGRMTELEAFLKSVQNRAFIGSATEKITGAREGLWNMQHRPEIAFRCGPLALQSVRRSLNLQGPEDMEIFKSASTQKGFSLMQVAELSRKVGLNYQMAFREKGAEFVVPSVLHWKVGHYAAMVRAEGDRFLLEDPTFGNTVWATREALEEESSGYFLIAAGEIPPGWRKVDAKEGDLIWGKGQTSSSDPGPLTRNDPRSNTCGAQGMAVPSVHLMLVSLHLEDEPVGYSPPVGPPVRFTVSYNQRDAFQPANFSYSNFGPKWTCDWISYITDSPQNPSADVTYYAMGGGLRTFTGFNPSTQTYAFQQYDQTLLKRTGTNSYELLSPDGSKLVFSQPDGSVGSSRKVFLTQVVDSAGNTVTLTYDDSLRLMAITDAIGQVTTLSYGLTNDIYKITRVTDPFGRFATFDYTQLEIGWTYTLNTTNCIVLSRPSRDWWLYRITDVLGLASQFRYLDTNTSYACADCGENRCVTNKYYVDFIASLSTPYGTHSFFAGPPSGYAGTTRSLEIVYPDGSRDRVESNQSPGTGIPNSDPQASVPVGMSTYNSFLYGRNTFYWNRNSCATSYGDYSKAKIYHWLHTADLASTAGILESTKSALEGRVWYDYGPGNAYTAKASNRPRHIGRVLDDGQTQLYTYTNNSFGRVTTMIDPVGRKFTFLYATNDIDLLEVRQTRAGNNELLAKFTYNDQHRVLTSTDAAGQTSTNTYNPRGQLLTHTNPKGETTTYSYDGNGYLTIVDGPLPGTNDSIVMTYDSFGRVKTSTDESGYTLAFDYDNLDRLTKITFPDNTFMQRTYNRLDLAVIRDRAGRQVFQEYDSLRHIIKRTDSLNRVTRFQWCSCGSLGGMIDPMGRVTIWNRDVQGRLTSKQYSDGSTISYFYESKAGRLSQLLDEKQQITEYNYNVDDSLRSVSYGNTAKPTTGVSFTYDPDYQRIITMTDGVGTTLYSYNPITGNPAPGAGELASEDGPLPNDTITFGYDELGRPVHWATDGVDSAATYDAASRITSITNALGSFSYAYEGASPRLTSRSFPNGQTEEHSYGGNLLDHTLQRITHRLGATPISEFSYGRDIPAHRILTWSQQAGSESPLLYTFGYDDANQVLSATVTNGAAQVNRFDYSYDVLGNRLTEQTGTANYVATYNALNQISTTTAPAVPRTNEWDAANRLVAVNTGNQRTEFAYDGLSRLASIRLLTNGTQASLRRFIWYGNHICEERDAAGTVTKRFFANGVRIESGSNAGSYYYTRDHLGSIREVTDSGGNVRARYAYDPYGRRVRLLGDIDADFGFAGMFWAAEANLNVTRFRSYDAELGRWLSRDPLPGAEVREGPNLYAYVGNRPINARDPEGLMDSAKAALLQLCARNPHIARQLMRELGMGVEAALEGGAGGGGGATAAGVGGGVAGGIVGGVAAGAPAAAMVCETGAPAAESVLPEAETFLPGVLGGRLQAVIERIPEARRQYQAFVTTIEADFPETDNFMNLNGLMLPSWPQIVADLDAAITEIALGYVVRYGGSTAEARELIVRLSGFRPFSW
jgi:RHS repeat-associated protein